MSASQEEQQQEEMFLKLKRPLIFFDLETTGLDTQKDRIVEISAIKVFPDGKRTNLYFVINPTIPISEGATEKHHFTNEMVKDKPPFCDLAEEIYLFFKDCDLAGYNIIGFDIPMLLEEFHRCKMYPILLTDTKIVDAMTVYKKKESRSLTAAVKYFCNEDFNNAHSAQADVEATMKVLRHQLLFYNDLEPDVDFLHTYTCDSEQIIDFSGKFKRNKKGQITFNFSKHKGQVVNMDNKVHSSFFEWLENQTPTVEMRMAIKRIRHQHKCHKDCMEWLQMKNIITDVEKSLALYKTILTEENFAPFAVSREGKQLIVIYEGNLNEPLVLCDEDAKHVSLLILKNYFNSMGGLDYIQSLIAERA